MKIAMQLKGIENKKAKLEDLAHKEAIEENNAIDQKKEFKKLSEEDQRESGEKIKDIIAQINSIDAQNADNVNDKQPGVQPPTEGKNDKDGKEKQNVQPPTEGTDNKVGGEEQNKEKQNVQPPTEGTDNKVGEKEQNKENSGIDIDRLTNEYKQIHDTYIQNYNDIDKSITNGEQIKSQLIKEMDKIAREYKINGNYLAALVKFNFEDLKKYVIESSGNEFNNKTEKDKDDIIKNFKHLGDKMKNIKSELEELYKQRRRLTEEFNDVAREYYINIYKHYNYSIDEMVQDKNNIHDKFDRDYFGLDSDVDRKLLSKMLDVELPIFSNITEDKNNSKNKFKSYFNTRTNKHMVLFFGNTSGVADIIRHNKNILDKSRKDIIKLVQDTYQDLVNKYGSKENARKALADVIEKHRLEYKAARRYISGIADMFNMTGSIYNYKYGLPATDGIDNVNPGAIFNMLFFRKFSQEDSKYTK